MPQFLYEAGFSLDGMIGITQPRRVAVTSTAARVAYELKPPDNSNNISSNNSTTNRAINTSVDTNTTTTTTKGKNNVSKPQDQQPLQQQNNDHSLLLKRGKGKRGNEEEIKHKQIVGYQIRHDSSTVGVHTKIKFMTDGILLKEVTQDLLLRKYSVIILDEAHERNVNTDVLLGIYIIYIIYIYVL